MLQRFENDVLVQEYRLPVYIYSHILAFIPKSYKYGAIDINS